MSVPRETWQERFGDLDFAALEGPGVRTRTRLDRRVPPLLEIVLGCLGIAAGYIVLFAVIGLATPQRAPWHAAWFATWLIAGLTVLVGLAVFWIAWDRRYGRRLPVANDGLAAFAAAHGFLYREELVPDPTLPATTGDRRLVQLVGRRLASPVGAPEPGFEFGHRLYLRPDQIPYREPHPSIHDYGWYVAIRLPRALPHLALVRPEDRAESHLDHGSQYSLGLEFDRTFTLLCPPGYERDALYLFTPDVMAAMIDDAGAAGFGAEVIDDVLFFRFPAGPTAHDVFTVDIRRALLLVERTAAELAKQAANYRDERIEQTAAGLVALPGRRVRARRRPAAIVAYLGIPAGVLAPFAMFLPTAW